MNNPLVEFAVVIALFSVIGSATIAFMPFISFFTVLPVCLLMLVLHLGHGCLFMAHMRPLIADHPKRSRMESGLNTVVVASGAITVIILLMFTTAKVLTA
jgi:uncharacterized membrane protein